MDKLGNLIGRVIAKQPNNGQIARLRMRLALFELLGPELSAACEDVELRGSTLTVSVTNPALAHQLRLDGEQLIARLNATGPPRPLRSLRVRTGRAAARG